MSNATNFPHRTGTTALCNRRAEFITPEACIHCFWKPDNNGLRVVYRTSKDCAQANVTLTQIESPQQKESHTDDLFSDVCERLALVTESMRKEGYSQDDIDIFGRGFVLFLEAK